MADLTLINFELTTDCVCSLHKTGCSGIARDIYKHGGYVMNYVNMTVEEVLENWFDDEMIEMGWSKTDCKVHDCCSIKGAF